MECCAAILESAPDAALNLDVRRRRNGLVMRVTSGDTPAPVLLDRDRAELLRAVVRQSHGRLSLTSAPRGTIEISFGVEPWGAAATDGRDAILH